MNKKQVSIMLGIISLVLTILIFVQINTVKGTNGSSIVSETYTEDSLRDEVLKLKERYDSLYSQLESAEDSLENERAKATENSEISDSIEKEIKQANDYLGQTELTGKGVIVKLDDNKKVSLETIGVYDSIETYLVHDKDLIEVVNELKNAGAEAISVNDQRLVNTTSIFCDGNVVRINGEKVGAPFTINAIGNPERLYGALTRPEGYIAILNRSGVITEVKKSNSIKVSKYAGSFDIEYMKNID